MSEERISLEELAPYLPYGLRYICPEHMGSGIFDGYRPESVERMQPISMMAIFHRNLKVVLKPLNTLTQEEMRGEGFNSYIDYVTHELHDPRNKNRLDSDGKPNWRIGAVPYEMVHYLITQHYDVFGLIERGLAVNHYDLIEKYPEILENEV